MRPAAIAPLLLIVAVGCGGESAAAPAAGVGGPQLQKLSIESDSDRVEIEGYEADGGFVFHGPGVKFAKRGETAEPVLIARFHHGIVFEVQRPGEQPHAPDLAEQGLTPVEFSQPSSPTFRYSIEPASAADANAVMGRFLPGEWPQATRQ